jgi:hypothetical protein
MPKAKSGNFTLKRIVAAIPAHQAAHRFAALQRSGRYSEMRFIQRGKSAFDIVGYQWPDKGVRRKLGIGRARKNPDQFKPGDSVSVRLVGPGDRVHWIDAEVKEIIGRDVDGRAVYKCKYELGGKFFDKTCFPSEIMPEMDPWPNPRVGKFTEDQFERMPNWRPFDVGRNCVVRVFRGGDAAFPEFVDGRIVGVPKPSLRVVEIVTGLEKGKWITYMLRDIKKWTKKHYPDTSANPLPRGGGVTPNQVLFGLHGRTVVGWINKETPTKYQISYKVGAALKHVWRHKDKIKFQATGKKGRVKNDCPKTANPSGELAEAMRLSEKFHKFVPRSVHKVNIDWPKASMLIGPCVRLDYFSDKWSGKGKVYFHEFDGPCQLFAAARPQPDGDNLLIVKGKFEIRPEGITG